MCYIYMMKEIHQTEEIKMKLKSTNNVETNRYELEIVIDGKEYTDAVDKATKKGLAKITVPGFRKGHAPKAMVLKMFGADMFYQDALEEVNPKAVDDAIEASGLELADQKVNFELVSLDENGADFKIKITTKPEVKLGKYKGLKVERTIVSVSEDEIAREIDALKEKNARIVTVTDREAKDGDITVIDFEGFTDGKAFEGGKGENYELTLGSGTFIPGFEDQIVGHKIDEEFDVNVTFPKEYQAENLAGKEAVFKVKLHEIKTKEYPEVDDEFAKDVSEFDTLDELKKDIENKILEQKNSREDALVENNLLEQVVDDMTVEVPDCMIENRIDENVEDFSRRLQYQGMDIKMYMQYTGMDEEGFRKTFRESAEKQVKIRLALEAVAKAENLTASEEELEEEYKKIADMYKIEVAQVKAAIPQKGLESDITANKAIDIIKSSAEIENVENKAAKAAEKKPTAKKTAAKKPAAKKAEGEKEEKAAEKKPAAKKAPAKKTVAKKAEDGEKAAEKKPAAKKAPAKKPAAKKAAEKKETAE